MATSMDFGMAAACQLILGRGLINAQPWADAGEFDEGEIVGGELVVSGRDAPALLDLVEEPLDQVAVAVKTTDEVRSYVRLDLPFA
jgi:hypothetical protein